MSSEKEMAALYALKSSVLVSVLLETNNKNVVISRKSKSL
jgi:hypothetical protein